MLCHLDLDTKHLARRECRTAGRSCLWPCCTGDTCVPPGSHRAAVPQAMTLVSSDPKQKGALYPIDPATALFPRCPPPRRHPAQHPACGHGALLGLPLVLKQGFGLGGFSRAEIRFQVRPRQPCFLHRKRPVLGGIANVIFCGL